MVHAPGRSRWHFLLPSYGELSVFLIAFTIVALFGLDPGFRQDAYRAVRAALQSKSPNKYGRETSDLPLLACYAGLFLGGLCFSVYHAFSERQKGPFEKHLMLFFAMAASGVAGVTAGQHVLKDSVGIAVVFPVWNILNGVLLFYQIGLSEPSMLDDSQVTRRQLAAGSSAVLAILLVSRFAFSCHWSVAFSTCVAYSTSVSGLVAKLSSFRHNTRVQSGAAGQSDGGDEGQE